jgi:opacity protein-like surface antigen
MYVRILFLMLLSFSQTKLSAQQENYFNQPDKNGRDKIFFGGIVLGINPSQIDGDTYSGFHKAGLNTGLISYVKMNTKLLLSLELLFSQKGARNVQVYNSPAVGSVPIIYTAKLNYVEIPLMLHYSVANQIQLGAGASYSRIISDKETMDSYMPSSINNLQDTYRKQDINYLVGVSYQLYQNIFVRARYQYSVMSIRDANKIPIEFGTSSQYNNLFALQFVCLF